MLKDTQHSKPTAEIVVPQTLKLKLPPGGFKLEKGGVLPEIEVTFERCGAITAANDNVVFVCHALTGDAHVAGVRPGETQPSGWWEGMVGPGKGIDTQRYQVVCANILGGCKGTTGPSSINPETGKPYGSAFPKITVGDIVEVHRLCLQQIGITRLAAPAAALAVCRFWNTIRYPDETDKVIVSPAASPIAVLP